jgi:HK97 family phage prohead protease
MHNLNKDQTMKHKKTVYRTLVAKAERAKSKAGRTRVVASAPTSDRYDDIVAADWNLDHFKANPVVLWGHDYSIPPVGRVVELSMDGDNLVAEIEWDTDPSNKLGQTVSSQFKRGFLNAVSVGFTPGAQIQRSSLDEDDPMYGKKGVVHTQNELMELSAVPIPAHRDALAMRGFTPDQQRHILNVEETDEGYVVTYAKPEAEAPAEEDEVDTSEERAPDEYDEDEEDADQDDSAQPEADQAEEEEEEEEEEEDEEEDDEQRSYRFRRSTTSHRKTRKSKIRAEVRAALLDLIGSEPSIVEPYIKKTDALSDVFGFDS